MHPKASGETARPKVSLCVIAHDEEYTLPQCVGPLRGVVDEIVVADMGSGDRTRQVAESLGARVVATEWSDSFSDVRNAAMEWARGEWILWMDTRDRIDAENVFRIEELIGQLNVRNVALTMRRVGIEILRWAEFIEIEQVRLFPNHPSDRWKYRVCEQIAPSLHLNNCQVRQSAITLRHLGEIDGQRRRRELERDLRLLHLDHADDPNDPIVEFNLARYYLGLEQPDQALKFLSANLARWRQGSRRRLQIYCWMVHCHGALDQSDQTLRVAAEGLAMYPRDEQLLSAKAWILHDRGDAAQAEEAFRLLCEASKQSRACKEVRQPPIAGSTVEQNWTVDPDRQRRFRV